MQDDYSHPDHGTMEWREVDTDRLSIKGWRCTRCHTLAEPENADEVFNNTDCDHYNQLADGITGSL